MLGYFLTKEGVSLEIHEKTSRWGGLLRTEQRPYGSVEWAANGFIASALLEEVAKDLGISLVQAGEKHRSRYILYEQPTRWPLKWTETLILPLQLLWTWLRRSFQPRPFETLAQWGHRTLGRAFTEKVLEAAVLGIYALTPKSLSAQLVVGRFFRKDPKKKKGRLRGTVAPEDGMEMWIQGLVRHLENKGALLRLNSSIETVLPESEQFQIVATHIRDLTKISGLDFSAGFGQIPCPAILTCTLFFQERDDHLRGFGILFHPREQMNSLGCLFESDNFPRRNSCRTERYIFSENQHPDLLSLADHRVVKMALDDRDRFLPEQDPLDFHVVRVPQGYPAYTTELEDVLARVPLRKGNVFLLGNFTGSLGLGQIAEKCYQMALQISQELRRPHV